MQRNEAINFLKDLVNNCETLSPESIALDESSHSCKVIIKGIMDRITTDYVRLLASKYQLTTEENAGKLVISDKMQIPHI